MSDNADIENHVCASQRSNYSNRRRDKRTLKRIAVGAGQVLAVLALFGIVLYFKKTGLDFKWIVVGTISIVFFGLLCYRTQHFWGKPWYWVTFGGTFVVHIVGAVLIQRNRLMFPGMYYGSFGTLEYILLYVLMELLFS